MHDTFLRAPKRTTVETVVRFELWLLFVAAVAAAAAAAARGGMWFALLGPICLLLAGLARVAAKRPLRAWVNAATQRATQAKGKNQIQTGTSAGNKAAEQQIFGSIVDVGSNTTFKNAIDAYYGTFDSAFEVPGTKAADDFRRAWVDGVNAALSGQKDPATAMKDAQQVAQQAIDAAQ